MNDIITYSFIVNKKCNMVLISIFKFILQTALLIMCTLVVVKTFADTTTLFECGLYEEMKHPFWLSHYIPMCFVYVYIHVLFSNLMQKNWGSLLTKIVNTSFREGISPSSFKHAIAWPTLKKLTLATSILTNYFPMSNLPFMSKLIEKQLQGHLTEANALDLAQSGFRPGLRTETKIKKIK